MSSVDLNEDADDEVLPIEISEGQVFQTEEDIFLAIGELSKGRFLWRYTHDHSKHKGLKRLLVIRCQRSGHPERAKPTSESAAKKRKRMSLKCDCPFFIRFSLDWSVPFDVEGVVNN